MSAGAALALVVAIIFGTGLWEVRRGSAAGAAEPVPVATSPAAELRKDAAAVARGAQLFRAVCAGYCHATTPGARDAPYLFDCTWKHGGSDREIFATISNGVPGTRMIAFGGKLPEGDTDVWSIIAFFRENSECPETP